MVVRPRPALLGFLLGCVGVGLCASPVAAQDPKPTLSGTWSATALTERWSTSEWGDACGPKPSPQGAPGGSVQVAEQGGELSISGAGRAYVTNQCWEQMPGLSRASHSASSRGWSTRCATPANDPRRATVVTNVSATDDTIVLSETGTYEFHVDATTCRASVSRSRSFKLVSRAGEAPAASAAPTAAPVKAPKPTPREPDVDCSAPGPVAKLTLRPLRKLMRPGETFGLTASVTDAKGCRVGGRPVFRVAEGAPQADVVRVDEQGVVAVDPGTQAAEYPIVAELAGKEVRVTIEVVAAAEYDRVLSERGLDASGEDARIASVEVSSGVGGTESVAADTAKERRKLFALVVGGVSAILALAGFILVRRGRGRRRAEVRVDDPIPGSVAFFERSPDQPMRCEACDRLFPPDASFCDTCGGALIPATGEIAPVSKAPPTSAVPASKKVSPPKARGKICPLCGDRFESDATFCGKDGASLLPLN